MTYDREMVLKRDNNGFYVLYTSKGLRFYECRELNREKAMQESLAYMSTWNSVIIRTEEEYEQKKQRDSLLK